MLAAVPSAFARESFSVPSIRFLPASPANYTNANRPTSSIRKIVIHVTESGAGSAISWFKNPRAQASAHYVVGQDGSIVQMVRDSDIAWQAGNWLTNRESIGIEHAGYTYRKGTFTDVEYRSSARLVAAKMRSLVMPIDRRHIIGHNNVPDPNHAGLFGGFAHHTDPGPYWNWPLYMTYVKTYARGGAPAPKVVNAPAAPAQKQKPTITATVDKGNKVAVSSSGLRDGATVQGYVDWKANVSGVDITRIEFLVDGRVRGTGKSYSWDTTKEPNGSHVLTLRVVTKKGATAGQSMRVNVSNSPFTVASANLTNGATLAKTVRWEAVPAGAKADHIDFLLDGKLVNTEKDAPFLFQGNGSWDTTKADNGPHTLTLRAVSVDGRIAESTLGVTVANVGPTPRPKPSPISIVMNGLYDGATVSGKVSWTASSTGGTPRRVEFWIDGRWRWSEESAPYVFNGDGNTWDTAKEKAGRHQVSVRAIGPDGRLVDWQTYTVTVQSAIRQDSAPTATTMAVASSIADGATVHDGVAWTATVNGATPKRVDFYIDGKLRHTEQSAPYEFGSWDTTKEGNGAHTLLVRATASDGSTAEVTQTVQVSNTFSLSSSLADGASATGTTTWTVTAASAGKVEFWIDGKLRKTDTSTPFSYSWDTMLETVGAHTLLAKAFAGTIVDEKTFTVTVGNAGQKLAIAASSLASGQTVYGTVEWKVTTAGATPDKVELYVDGTVRATGTSYTWDTTKDADGAHTVLVKATVGDQVAQQSFAITIRNTPSVKSTTIANGATVSGTKAWTVTTQGPPADTVELLVDGAVRATGLSYSWDTTKEAEGAHTLAVRITVGAQAVNTTYAVTVANTPLVNTSTITGGTAWGTKTWTVTTKGATPTSVKLLVDGSAVATALSYVWDTTKVSEGPHTLTVELTTGALTSTKSYTVTVANTPVIASSTLTGGTQTGTVTWSVTSSGHAPDKVELYVDGSLRQTGTSYAWDTTRDTDGSHTLLVKAYSGSLVATRSYTVTVDNAPVAITAQSIADNATIAGSESWSVTTNGTKVEFYVDGTLVKTDTTAPFSTTLALANGAHELVAKAYKGATSTTATRHVTVTVPVLAVTQNIVEGQTLSGTITWTATPSGKPISRVQFLINGSSAGTFRSAPYSGTLDTRRLANGTYTFAAKVTATDGTTVTASVSVTVRN
jgi:N-acetyl-anhydromuramyl-L-alanine amidase AmpD